MNIMTKVIALTALMLGVFLGSNAQAQLVNYAGTFCNPNTSSDASNASYTQWGVQNNGTGSINVTCGGMIESSSSVFGLGATVYDRSPFADVCCTFLVQDSAGVTVQSKQRCSSGSTANAQGLAWEFVTAPLGSIFNMQCSVPGASTGGLSHITEYFVAN